MPKALISDRGTHFCNKIMEKTMKRYGVNHRFSTSYHPLTSGQVENTNRALKIILEKTVKDNPAIWSRKLDDALWAFHTAYKKPTGTTPYKLIYGKNCHLPFEIEHRTYRALKNCNPDLIVVGSLEDIPIFQWVSDNEPEAPEEAPQFPKQAPPSPDYMPGPEHPPSPDYVHVPENPPSSDYVPGLEYPEYLVPSDDEVPIEDQPLPADASPTALSPGYVVDSDLKEDPEEDPAEYPGGDDNVDDDDDDEEEEEEEDDEEKVENIALADSTALHTIHPISSAEDTKAFKTDEPAPTPPRSHRLHRARISRARFTTPTGRFEVGESSSAAAARKVGHTLAHRVDYGFINTINARIRAFESRAMAAVGEVNERVTDLATTQRQYTHELQAMKAQIRALQRDVALLQRQRIRDEDRLASHIQHEYDRFRELVRTSEAGPQDGPADAGSSRYQGVANALAEIEANRTSRNGDDNHNLGTGSRRTERAARECTYSEFLKCQPFNFKGTEGVVNLTQWFENMEFVFHISNCTVVCQIKFATCTLLSSALTW
ncbi:putative reverse transcriptase domain-containing protein [Tanacetum coccineum]